MPDQFWQNIAGQLERLEHATSAAQVFEVCPPIPGTSAPNAQGFFEGGGGDTLPIEPLVAAGWKTVEWRARYWWAMRAPNGDIVTYIEGDLYLGDRTYGA